jgi:zinc protease
MTAPVAVRPPRPRSGPARDYHFPRVDRSALTSGVKIIVAPIQRLPIVTVLALVDAGADRDPGGREGLAQIVAKLLLEGAGELEGAELAEAFERLGASIESNADWDAAVVSMTITSSHLDDGFALFADVLRRPSFRERELERLKAERLAELLQLRAEPRGLADEAFSAAVYDASSRYALPEGGTETTVAAISRADVSAYYSQRYTPAATTLIVAGDVTTAQTVQLANKYLRDWNGAAPDKTPRGEKPARSNRAMHLVVKGDAAQSELRVGHIGAPRLDPDYFDIVVMNAILGGLFNSRINLNLREAHAYTYGAFSAFDWRRGLGPFVVSTAVKSEATADSIREVMTEIDRMRSDHVTPDELSLAISYLDGVFPIRYETTAAVAGALGNQSIYGLPDDYFDSYRSRIRAVTVESVLSAAQRHLHPQRMQAVVVGNAELIREPLEQLAFGPMVSTEPHAVFGSK